MTPEEYIPVDVFKDIPLGYTLIDWSDPSMTSDTVTTKFCGYTDYWSLPEFEGMKPWEIERQILFDAKRPNWGGVSKYDGGKPYFQHMLCLAKLMFPQTDITPSLYDVFQFFCLCIGKGNRKALHLIGSQSSGKSFGSCILAFVTMYIDPTYSAAFVANPFDKASASQEWGTCLELWNELIDAHPNNTGMGFGPNSSNPAPALFPWGRSYADKYIEFIPGLPKAGAIRVQGVKHEGKFRGIKAFGKDVERGVVLLIVGEINLIDNHSFYDMVDNLASQDAFIACSSQNFRDIEDLGGRVTEPSGLYGGKATFDDLDIDADQYWHSAKGSVTLRFDGHNSPNILAGRTIYPKLFKKENMMFQLENGGDASPSYFSQVRSFPIRGNENNSVLSRAKISASRHLDPWFTMVSVDGAVAFVDPAFGGNDSAVYGSCYWGKALVKDADGNQRTEELIVFDDYFHKVHFVKDALYNDFWIDRLVAAGVPTSEFTVGSEVSFEDQIAIVFKEYTKKRSVRNDCVGYDFSMRPDIVSSMNKVFGFSVNAFDYNQGPEGVFLQNLKQNSEDCCKNRNTELAFLAADYFLTKQIRGGSYIENAITQLSRTLYATVNKKFVSESKPEYKKRWSGKSPDHRDVLVGLAGLAHRKGFRSINITAGTAGAKSAFSAISALNVGKSGVIKKIKSYAMR